MQQRSLNQEKAHSCCGCRVILRECSYRYTRRQLILVRRNAGPLPAQVQFLEPIRISWDDHILAEMDMVPFAIAEGQAKLDTTTHVHVVDGAAFGDFNRFMIHQPQFTWTLQSKVSIRAYGMTVGPLLMKKRVDLKGCVSFLLSPLHATTHTY